MSELQFMSDLNALWQVVIKASAFFIVPGLIANVAGVFVFRRFDRMFKNRPNIADFGIPGIGIMARTFTYMSCVVFKNKSSKGRIWSVTFEGYDFQVNTNLLQKVLSHICLWGYILGFLIGMVALLLKLTWA